MREADLVDYYFKQTLETCYRQLNNGKLDSFEKDRIREVIREKEKRLEKK